MILNLCISELHATIGGELKLGLMPPLAGQLEPVRRVVVDSAVARPGDVFWGLHCEPYDGACLAEEAYARGALGVVTSTRKVEPWAGKFAIRVDDANTALGKLAEYTRLRDRGRRCKPTPFHPGDTTGMVAAMFRGAKLTVNDIVSEMVNRRGPKWATARHLV